MNARSTTAETAISEAIVRPAMVVIGIAALRSTCRRSVSRNGMPRLTAVWTCSRPSSSRTAARVTRATSAIDVIASAIAGSVRCSIRPATPSPSPVAGNQPRFTANTSSRMIAATNAGRAAEIVVATITPLSVTPGLSAASTPRPIPTTRIRSDAYRTSPSVTVARSRMMSDTSWWCGIETPKSPVRAAFSHSQ